MTSVYTSHMNFQQQQHQFQMLNPSSVMLQQQQQQQQLYVGKHQTIAPAAPAKILGTSNLQNIQAATDGFGPMLSKKKYTYVNMPYGEQLPSVARRNARERNRVKQVNNGFAALRQHIPQSVINMLSNGGRGASKKLSKVDTLRIAVEYIRGLEDMLEETQSPQKQSSSGGGGGDGCATGNFDDSSIDGSHCDYSSAGSPVDGQHYHQFAHGNSYHSEASVSPTPSYTDSDISIGAASYIQPIQLDKSIVSEQHSQEMIFKFEPFDNYNQIDNNDDQPDDEELLDYISSWQEQ